MNAPVIDLRQVTVPREEWLTASLGPVALDVLATLEEHRFDEAPVCHGADVVGILETTRLRALADAGGHVTAEACRRAADPANLLLCAPSYEVPLGEILRRLCDRRSVLVGTADAEGSVAVERFLTLSDLNRHPFRAALFGPLCELESQLARVIQMVYPTAGDEWPWLRHLNEDAKVKLLGYWHLSRSEGIDLYPTVAATLTQLLQVIEKDQVLRQKFAYSSGSQASTLVRRLSELRNRVMHPVRPLVLKQDDVVRWHETVQALSDLTARAARVLG